MRKLRWTLGHVLSIENFQVNRPCQQYARALLKPYHPALLAVLLELWVSPPFEQERRQLGVPALPLSAAGVQSGDGTRDYETVTVLNQLQEQAKLPLLIAEGSVCLAIVEQARLR